jgi:mannose-6-phosphate isomerase-like protein (cupin superfamily)
MDPVVLPPGEGERHEMGPNSTVIKATSEDTDGRFFLSETTIGPGFQGPPVHVHSTLHDMFYVLEGTLTVRVRDDDIDAGPGTFVCIRPDTPHKFSNESGAPVRFLNFNTPGGFENYMRDLAEAAAGGQVLGPREIGEIASRYDFRAV